MKKKKKGTKERIRNVAIDLFSQKGYNAVSIRDIARLVNIHESSIYSHFKGKEDIMDHIIEFLIDEFRYDPNQISLDDLLDNYDPEMLMNNAISPIIEQLKVPHIRKIMRLMCIELYQNIKFLDFFKDSIISFSFLSILVGTIALIKTYKFPAGILRLISGTPLLRNENISPDCVPIFT
ncbi:MAG: TetR/AcrR family transcriptional regulator [Candidatus Lokiarchaeota archaeon]|nr:TetR/AcrR family transcriptional regulator [Candidatus Lokiarchaeota archaeon]